MTVNDRIDELESRLAFQDDTVHSLNEVVARQQREIDQLQLQLGKMASLLRSIRDEIGSASGGGSLIDERPPHY